MAVVNPPEYVADEIRRACLELQSRHPQAKRLLLTSPIGHEGTTTIACLCGRVLAEMNGGVVAVVDANIRSPAMHQKFAIGPDNGLRDWEPGKANGTAHPSAWDRLSVIPVGSGNGRSLQYLQQSGRLADLAARLSQDFAYVIWDTPPLNRYPDAGFLLPYVDGVLIVAEADATPLEELSELYEKLATVNAAVLGVILNRTGRYLGGERRSRGTSLRPVDRP